MIRKQTTALLLALLLATASLAGCAAENGDESETQNAQANVTAQTVSYETEADYDQEDVDSSWDAATAVMITLNGDSIEIDGSGATAQGGVLTISAAGTYVVSGTLSDGQIVVAAGDTNTVRLVLNGAEITCATGAPIYASAADKLILTLEAGTENTMTDGGDQFVYANTTDEEPNAAIFSKCDLSINGEGKLVVNAGFNNGIGTKDDLIIANGTYVINAANDAIRGRDSLQVLDGDFTITAAGDGIQSNNDTDASKGWILLNGGTYDITAGNDGIQAETALTITDGVYDITTNGGADSAVTQAAAAAGAMGGGMGGRGGGMPGQADASAVTDTAATGTTAEAAVSDSYKGLKAGGDLTISGGTFTISSYDDSIHANGSVTVTGGSFTLASSDDGIHADEILSISSGVITITESYEGLEGATVNITGGAIDIYAADDAINAAGGSDSSGMVGGFAMDAFGASGDYSINISGGEISFVAGGDGIDSNGDVTISGGTVIALISSTSDNMAIDCDSGTFTFTGGTLLYGGTGVGPVAETETQSYVYVTGVPAGESLSVRGESGEVVSFVPAIDCQYLLITAPGITAEQSYDVYSGEALLASVTAGTGEIPSGMGGGMGGQGGMQRDGRQDDSMMPQDGGAPDMDNANAPQNPGGQAPQAPDTQMKTQ